MSVPEIFSFGPFGRAIALAAGASASTPNPLGFGIAWRGRSGGYDPCRRQTVQKKNERRRRIGAPLRFPAPPRMGMAGHGPLSESSRSEAEGPLSPAPWGRAGWDPAALGPAGFAKGRCPLASAHSRMSNTGFSRPPSILLFPCGFCGLPAVRPADLSCRLGDGSRSVPVRP